MKFPLLRKTIGDARWLLIACTGMLFAFAWIRVIIVASMERYQFQRIARNLPDMFKRLSPVPIDELVSFPGLIGFTFEEPIVYLIMAAWTISRASDIVSGELGRGTLEMLLAQPVGRLRYVATHTFVTLVGIVVLATAAYAGTRIGVQTTHIRQQQREFRWNLPAFLEELRGATREEQQDDDAPRVPMTKYVDVTIFKVAAINYACLGFFLTGITTAMSAWDRHRWRTIGIVVGFYILETVIELTGMAVEKAHWMLYFTFFAVYEPVAFVTQASKQPDSSWRFFAAESHGQIPDLGPLGCDTVLVVYGAAGLIAGTIIFCRRDLPAPL